MKPQTPEEPQQALDEQAGQWFLLNRDGALSSAQQQAFLAWLQRSPAHVRAYLRSLHLHRQIGAALAARPAQRASAAPPRSAAGSKVVPLFANAPAQRRGQRPRRRLWQAAAAVATISLLAGLLLSQQWPAQQLISAGHGELREVVLADNSRLRLNADSAVRVRMGWRQRQVELLQGEASFDVAADRRPFQVQAGQLRVRDIGTVFDVSRRLQSTRIGVVSGEVEVWGGDQASRRLARLDAGQVVLVDNRSFAVQTLDMPASMLLDWQQRKVSFLDERLDEVALAFNRHNTMQVVIDDELAAAQRLSGSLDADRLAALQAFLARDPRFVVQRQGDRLHVGSR